MSAEIKLSVTSATKSTILGNVSNDETKDLTSFYKEMSKGALFDTGILPLAGTGVLSVRQSLNYMQVVFQHEPYKYYINWGAREGDGANGKAPTYHLAQPYRIVIGDFIDGSLIGARTFYSPYPVQTGEAPLYHANLPNLNCKGYGARSGVPGNGVGWLCLYHKGDNWQSYTVDQKIRRMVERASGVETYNDGNMSGTDGPRFYKEWYSKHKAGLVASHTFLWDPAIWQKKTEEEGYEWVLDEDLWIPILVQDMDHQEKHYPDGVQLTLDMATLGNYSAYYTDNYIPKPTNAFIREDLDDPSAEKIFENLTSSFLNTGTGGAVKAKAKPKLQPVAQPPAQAVPVVPQVVYCPCCGDINPTPNNENLNTMDGVVCQGCWDSHCYEKCAGNCGKYYFFENLQVWTEADGTNNLYCYTCKTVLTCPTCGTKHDSWNAIVAEKYCTACTTMVKCKACGGSHPKQEIKEIQAKTTLLDTMNTIQLCNDCFMASVICACGILKNEMNVGLLPDGTYACEPCIVFDANGMPSYKSCEAEDGPVAVAVPKVKAKVAINENVFLKATTTN